MATKEDILEQIVEEYLIHEGYFVQHNLKFCPRPGCSGYERSKDSNHSGIDVIGFNPKRRGDKKVVAVSCKSWQGGFRFAYHLDAIRQGKVVNGRPAWQAFRELTVPKWSKAFVDAVKEATGTDRFTYVLAVTKGIGDKARWEEYQPFSDALGGNPVKALTFRDMVLDIQRQLTKTFAATEVGRMLQLFQVAGILSR